MECTRVASSSLNNRARSGRLCKKCRRVAVTTLNSRAYPPEQVALVSVQSTPVSSQSFSLGPVALCCVGALGVAALAVVAGKSMRTGSMDSLASRGYLGEAHEKKSFFDQGLPTQVNTMYIEELSEDQISAARARRSRERSNTKLTLEEVELPENHPWAVKHPVSQDEDALIKARLSARRGLPVQSLNDSHPAQNQGPQRIGDLQQV